MTLLGYRAQNHPSQVSARGAIDEVDDRETDPRLFEPLHERFSFTIDVAANHHNAKLPRYYTLHDNGLSKSWAGERVWCNPPFSDIEPWVRKAAASIAAGEARLVVMLIPANRTEQRFWQDNVEPIRDRLGSALRVEFLPGRPRFLKPGQEQIERGSRPPWGCVLLIWEASA